MQYYKIPKKLDGRQIYVHSKQNYISFAGGELYTFRELEALGLKGWDKLLEAVEVSRKKNILVLWRALRYRGHGKGGYSMKAATLRKRIATRLTTKGGALKKNMSIFGCSYSTRVRGTTARPGGDQGDASRWRTQDTEHYARP